MAFSLSSDEKKYFMKFIREHPIPKDFVPYLFDDRRIPEYEDASTAYFMKKMLEEETC